MSRADLGRVAPPILGDRYQLMARIGSGASAEVYQATDLRLRRSVAVKQLRSDLSEDARFAKLFRSEAHLAAQLSHPNILTVFDWSEDAEGVDGGAYIVTELLTGGSLRTVLDAEGTISPAQAAHVGLAAARGLAAAHAEGLVHRDVKPANLLFGGDGRVHIGDFGIARAVAQAAWTEPEGVLIGTARYAAPEQAKGGPVDGMADVYSLTVCLIEALVGDVPLVRENALGTMVLRQTEDLPVDDSFGPLAEPLARAGVADPGARSSAAELADALAEACAKLPAPEPLTLLDLTEHVGGPVAVEPNVRIGPDGELVIEGDGSDLAIPADGEATPELDQADGQVDGPVDGLADGSAEEETLDPPDDLDDAGERGPLNDLTSDDYLTVSHGDRPRRRSVKLLVALVVFAVLGVAAVIGGQRLAETQRPDVETVAVGLPSFTVEDYRELTVAEVQAAVATNRWSVSVSEEFRDGSEPGVILSQDPPPGAAMGYGGAVALVVSLGPVPRAVPEMIGVPEADVRTALEAARLIVGEVSERFDEAVAAGVVVDATIDGVPAQPGSEFLTGTVVDLVVSAGPAPREVPPLEGLTVEQARVAVTDQDLVLATAEAYSESVAEGLVISVDPGAGTRLARGGTVTVTVSLGRPFVAVPDVVGLAVPEAIEALKAQGFEVEINGTIGSTVLATRPTAGEMVRSGSRIEIISSN